MWVHPHVRYVLRHRYSPTPDPSVFSRLVDHPGSFTFKLLQKIVVLSPVRSMASPARMRQPPARVSSVSHSRQSKRPAGRAQSSRRAPAARRSQCPDTGLSGSSRLKGLVYILRPAPQAKPIILFRWPRLRAREAIIMEGHRKMRGFSWLGGRCRKPGIIQSRNNQVIFRRFGVGPVPPRCCVITAAQTSYPRSARLKVIPFTSSRSSSTTSIFHVPPSTVTKSRQDFSTVAGPMPLTPVQILSTEAKETCFASRSSYDTLRRSWPDTRPASQAERLWLVFVPD